MSHESDGTTMRFVLLIHSNPQPWGHPTSDHTREYQSLPQATKDELGANWQKVFDEAVANGEVVSGCALGDPARSAIFRYDGAPQRTDGPYSRSEEHLAGFFILEVSDQQRAEQIAASFCCPGDTVELRPVMGNQQDA